MQRRGESTRVRGQRQDVAFLALAVAVLAVAVALFVGIRSLPGRAQRKPEAKPGAAAAPSGPRDVRPPGSASHDPFQSRSARAPQTPPPAPGAKKDKPEEQIKLVGIVRGGGPQPLAVLRHGQRSYRVRVGDRVAGYTLASIAANRVVLSRAEEDLVLPLQPPAAAEEAD